MPWITRFDEVTAAFVERREYTDFAFQQLRSEMQSGFGGIERKLNAGRAS